MKAHVIGVTSGEYQGQQYGRIHTVEPLDANANGRGMKCVIHKVSPASVVQQVVEVDQDYDLVFNPYGRVVEVRPL